MINQADETTVSNHVNVRRVVTVSSVITVLMVVTSLISLLFPKSVYPTEDQRQSFLPNDYVNLIIGLPVLLTCIWLAQRGKLAGLLLLPGGLLFLLYNAIALVLGQPLSGFTLVNGVIALGCLFVGFDLLVSLTADGLRVQVDGAVPVRLSGWLLVLFGGMFFAIAVEGLLQVGMDLSELKPSEFGVTGADLVVSLIWMAGGLALLRQKPIGYAAGLGLLFAGVILNGGLVILLMIRPALTGVPFDPAEPITVLIFGLICAVPFVMFLRGVNSRD